MKGISQHTMVIILSLVLMLVIMSIGINWVQGASEIDFDKAWYIGPETAIPTEPDLDIGTTNSYNALSVAVTHIFTTAGNPHDMSEIACFIAEDIFNDFSKKGDTLPRSCSLWGGKGVPFSINNDASGCLISARSFLYKTDASANPADEAALMTYDLSCRLCRVGNVGIKHLDETCINLQFSSGNISMATNPRLVGARKFCDGTFFTDSDPQKLSQFGNNHDGTTPTENKNLIAAWDGYCDQDANDEDDYCDNNMDYIRWQANRNDGSQPSWPATDFSRVADWRTSAVVWYDYNSGDNSVLTDGYEYMYGIFWIAEAKKYDIVFAMIPRQGTPETNFNKIWEEDLDWDKNFWRTNPLGNIYVNLREVHNNTVVLAADTTISTIMIGLKDHSGVITDKIGCLACSNDENCINKIYDGQSTQIGDEKCVDVNVDSVLTDAFKREPIEVRIKATKSDGTPVTCNDNLVGGRTYRVIVKNWFGFWEKDNWVSSDGGCYANFDRSVSIIQV